MAESTATHPSLGTLVFEDDYKWWTCRADIRPGYSFDFCLSTWTGASPQLDTPQLLERGAHYLDWVRQSEEAVRHRVAEDFTEPYNDFWSDAYGPLTKVELQGRVTINSIQLFPDGSAYW